VFGFYATHPLRPTAQYVGNGEAFVFSLRPSLHIYNWSSKNDLFQLAETEYLSMGGGPTGVAVWLDSDIFHGTSQPCQTFESRCLASANEFLIVYLEVWGFR